MPTILIADDDISLIATLAAVLERAGYRVQRASRVDQASRIIISERIDLTLLEVGMEHGRGWELLREIAQIRGGQVIVLTGYGVEEDIVSAFDIGASDVIPKPYRTNELLARVRARLRAADVDTPAIELPPDDVEHDRSIPPRPDRYDEYNEPADNGPIFMDAADEHTLLRDRIQEEVYEGDLEELPLGERLHAARKRKNLSLVQVELDTKLRIWYLQAMEESRFGMLPRSGMAEQMLRTYAEYLGVDVAHAVSDFRGEFADIPMQPLANLGGRPEPREIPQRLIIGVAVLLALVLGLGGWWLFAPDQVTALGSNMRALVSQPTPTLTPAPTRAPTLTPTRTPEPTATSTPRPTATSTPSPTVTPQPTVDSAATASPSP